MQPATARDEAAISPRRGGSRRQPVEMDPAWQARRLPPKQSQRWPEKIDPGSRRRTSLAVSAEKAKVGPTKPISGSTAKAAAAPPVRLLAAGAKVLPRPNRPQGGGARVLDEPAVRLTAGPAGREDARPRTPERRQDARPRTPERERRSRSRERRHRDPSREHPPREDRGRAPHVKWADGFASRNYRRREEKKGRR